MTRSGLAKDIKFRSGSRSMTSKIIFYTPTQTHFTMSSINMLARRQLSTSSRVASSSRPLLPSGRLSADQLRQLVDLHHSAATFITPSSLSQIVESVFDQTYTRTASDESLRDAAARQLERGGIPGQKADTLVELSVSRTGQSLKGIRNIYDERLLGYASPSVPSRAPTAVTLYRRTNGSNSLSWSDEKVGETINPAGVHQSGKNASGPLGYEGSAYADNLVALRESRRDDALFGTVGKSRPGLEAVLDHMRSGDAGVSTEAVEGSKQD